MKKYIGLTIFFVGLVILSFLFSNISKKDSNSNNSNTTTGNNNSRKKIKKEAIKTNNNQENNNKQNKIAKNTTGNITNKKKDNFNIIPIHNKQNTGDNTNNHTQKTEKIIPDNLYIGLSSATLIKDSKFEEIFTLFGLDNIPLYKAENKEIYIKQLSGDYEQIKSNFENIIKKIGGNDVETNLYGDKQTFLNPQVYYKKDVIMLINYEKSNYLVVLPYKNYGKYKNFMKETLFVK